MKLNLASLFLAVTAVGANDQTTSSLRGHRELNTHGYHERLNQCRGATCNLWGDPHIVSCDGAAYDCQGIGIFQLMDNHMYNIQGNFVDVGDREHVLVKGWGLTHGASITNDIVVEYKLDDSIPTMQFGFGDVKGYETEVPTEEGCQPWTTMSPVDMGRRLEGARTVETLATCRKRCEANKNCDRFSWWADGGCHLNKSNARFKPSPRHWPRALVGTIDSKCGTVPVKDLPLKGSNMEQEYHGEIDKCPLLMYLDGELVDLSDKRNLNHAYLYGGRGQDHFVEVLGNKAIRIAHKLPDSDDWSEMVLRQVGHGPGELWSCHWNFDICLPAAHKDQFMSHSLGLFGTPNGNQNDDWMTKEGETLKMKHWGRTRHKDTLEYCVDNWCVSQEDSIMSYHGDTTYDDHKCEKEPYVDYREDNELCVLDADQIELACKDVPPLMVHACHVDCCFGGCGQIEEVVETLKEIRTLSDNDKAVEYEFNKCTDTEKKDTSSTKCPNGEVVKLLKTKGDQPLPEGDIFYNFEFNDGVVGFNINNPFEAGAAVFVKHDKKVLNNFMDPTCDGQKLTASGCDDNFHVEVACHDFDDVAPFALVSVYFASVAVSPLNEQASIDKCCQPEEFSPAVGVVEYTFEVQCGCPGEAAE